MSTRLLLEGPDLEELLERIKDEHGAAARIVSAERVRTGGVAGFFTKQRFEIALDVFAPDEDVPGEGAPLTTDPDVAGDRTGTGGLGAGPDQRTDGEAELLPPVGLAELLTRVEAEERQLDEVTRMPRSATRFAHLLAEQAADPAPVLTGRVSTPPAITGPAAPTPDHTVVADDPDGIVVADDPDGIVVADDPDGIVVADDPDGIVVADDPDGIVVADDPDGIVVADQPDGTAVAPTPPTVSATRSVSVVVEPATDPGTTVVSLASPPAPAKATTGPHHPQVGPTRLPGYEHPAVALVRAGLPVHLAARAVGPDLWSAVARSVASLPYPAALPSHAGEVLVLVGETEAALILAGQVAALAVGVDPDATLIAGSVAGTGFSRSHRISGPAEAIARAAELHSSRGPRIVVVEATSDGAVGRPGGGVPNAATEVPLEPAATITALAPSQVWACVDATRKNADTGRFLHALGRVDALAVYGAAATVEPGSVLHFGIPVVMLDGRPATARRWTTLLCERLGGQPPSARWYPADDVVRSDAHRGAHQERPAHVTAPPPPVRGRSAHRAPDDYDYVVYGFRPPVEEGPVLREAVPNGSPAWGPTGPGGAHHTEESHYTVPQGSQYTGHRSGEGCV